MRISSYRRILANAASQQRLHPRGRAHHPGFSEGPGKGKPVGYTREDLLRWYEMGLRDAALVQIRGVRTTLVGDGTVIDISEWLRSRAGIRDAPDDLIAVPTEGSP